MEKCASNEIKVYLNIGSRKTILLASPCCRFRSNLGHFDALKPGRISRIMSEVCIIQSDDRISITIVKKTNQQLSNLLQQCNSIQPPFSLKAVCPPKCVCPLSTVDRGPIHSAPLTHFQLEKMKINAGTFLDTVTLFSHL